MEDPVVPLERNLYGHPCAGLLWKWQLEKILLQHGWEKVSNWEWLFVHRQKGLFLSVYVDDIKLAGKKQNINPMWKLLNKEVDLGEPTSFLDHVYLGCTQMFAKLHTVQSMMTLIFMNQTAMDDPNVIVLMNVSGNTTPKQRPSDTTKTRQFLTPRLDARLHACASPIYQNLSTDSLQSSVIGLRALLARWKDTHDLRMLKPSTIHPCIHHPINNVAPRITGPTKNAIIIPEDKLICTSNRT